MERVVYDRTVDELGRITLPRELRKMLDIEAGESLYIFVDEPSKSMVLKKIFCCSCGANKKLKMLSTGKYICKDCLISAGSEHFIL